MTGQTRPAPIEGLSVFNKRVVLTGSSTAAKTFRSGKPQFDPDAYYAAGLPEAVVEAVDPIVLASQTRDSGADDPSAQIEAELPRSILEQYDTPLVLHGCARQLYATLGQFSTVRLEQGTQLLVPVFEGYVPEKECSDETGEEAPCDQFSRVEFPVSVFYPAPPAAQSVTGVHTTAGRS